MWNNGCPFGNLGNFGAFGTWGWIGMILNILFWVGLAVGLVVLTIWLVRRAGVSLSGSQPGGQQLAGAVSAVDIAQVRYARGEISREEYLMLVEDLR